MSLEFGGANSVTIPRRDRTEQSSGDATGLAAAAQLGQQMGGAFVGENGVIPVKQAKLTSAVMNRFKMAVISALTTELLEQSTPNIEAIIRASILEDTALALDGAFLDGVLLLAACVQLPPLTVRQHKRARLVVLQRQSSLT